MSLTSSVFSTQSSVIPTNQILHQSPLIVAPLQTVGSLGKSIAFIDAAVADYQTLVAGLAAGTEVYRLDGGDAIAQITQTLLGQQGIESIQIFSHGMNGGLQLGQSWLNAAVLPTYVDQIKSWGDALTADADILLYGCNVAQDGTGKAFVNLLAQATGADVAASDDLTGNAALGGDWDLEVRSGDINNVFGAGLARLNYDAVLNLQLSQFTNLPYNPSSPTTPSNLTAFKDALFFTINTANGTELHSRSLYDQMNNSQSVFNASGSISNLIKVKETLYFTVHQGGETRLWQIAASPSNNSLNSLQGFQPPEQVNGWISLQPVSQAMNVQDRLFFVAGGQLWHIQPQNTDIIGAAPTNYPVSPRSVGPYSNVSQLFNIGGTLYFATTSGSNSQLNRVVPLVGGDNSMPPEFGVQLINTPPLSNLTNLQMVGNTLYFTATEANESGLYRLDSNQNSVLRLNVGPIGASPNPRNLMNVNGKLFFVADVPAPNPVNPQVPTTREALAWINGTGNPEIMQPIVLSNDSLTKIHNPIQADGVIYFIGEFNSGKREVWRYNTNVSNSQMMPVGISNMSEFPNLNAAELAYGDGKVFFTATTSANSTRLLYVFQHDANSPYSSPASRIQLGSYDTSIDNLKSFNGNVYVTSTSPSGSTKFWQSEDAVPYGPTPYSLFEIGNIYGASNPVPGSNNSPILSDWTVANGKVLLVSGQASGPKEILAISSSEPSLGLSNSINYTENAAATLIAPYGFVSPLKPGSQITVRIEQGTHSSDRFTIVPNSSNGITIDGQIIKYQNQEIATFSGGIGRDLVITLKMPNPDQPLALNTAEAILRQIAYSSAAEREMGSRRIEMRAQDVNGGAVRRSIDLYFSTVDDASIVGIQKELPIGRPDLGWVMAGPPGTILYSGTNISTTQNLLYQAGLSIKTDVLPTLPQGFTPPANDPYWTTISMEAATGFAVNFEVEVMEEIRGSNADRNLDGLEDRAGFSVLVVSNDPTKAIELGFLGDRIWAQEDGMDQANSSLSADPSNPYRTLFTQAEGVGFNTRRMVRYNLIAKGETYTLFANGQAILSGRLRNYSNATIASGPNPYTVSNTIFFGDNTTAASANVRFGIVSVVGIPTVNETVIDERSAQTSTSDYSDYGRVRIGQLVGLDVDQTINTDPRIPVDLVYQPNSNFSAGGTELQGVRLDFESQTSYTALVQPWNSGTRQSLTVRVRNADDRATLSVPTTQTMLEDGVLTFSNANGNAIKLQDVDQSLNPIEVRLTSGMGLMQVAGAIPNGVSVSGNNSSMITLTGSLTAINTILNGLSYRPFADQNTGNGQMPSEIWVEMRELLSSPTQYYPAAPRQISLNVTPVNDAPDFTPGANQTVTAGTSMQTIIGWASNFQAGPGEFQGVLGYEIVSNDRPDLFDGAITIDPTGQLTFKTVKVLATAGVATIGVRARDNGGMANGGVETSAVKFFTITVNPSPLSNWVIAAQADFDRDGKADILWRNEQTGWNVIWKMGTNGMVFSTGIREVGDTNWQIVGTGDFNGDGMTDILWRNKSTGWMNYWQMNDTSWQQSVILPTVVDADFQIAAIADFDNDGKSDIMWRNKTKGWNNIWKMGTNGWQQSIVLNTVGTEWQVASVADFNQDGKVDIFWRHSTQGWNVLWFMNGMVQQQSIALETRNSTFQIAGTADFDGDGKIDILWRHSSTGEVSIWTMNSSIRKATIPIFTVTAPDFQIAGIKDTNGDGKPDILWRNRRNGWNVVWKLNGTSIDQILQLDAV